MRLAISLALLALVGFGASAATKGLDIYFIDVEGGQSTLIVTPAGESMLIDTGYGPRGARGGAPAVPNGRDAGRILQAINGAGLDHLDYLLITHFHPDHAGGLPELAAKIPITTFVDYGDPLGSDRMATNVFRNYEPLRKGARHIVARAGEQIPLKDIEALIISADGKLVPKAIGDGGETNSACRNVEEHPEDGTENYRSVGVMFRYGAFRFLDVGDLSGMTLTRLACPKNLLGRVSVYLTSHHGDYDSNVPALYAALQPRVVVMNNGVIRGGSPDVFRSLAAEKSIEDLWQLHYSANSGAENSLEPMIANVDDGTQTAHALRLTAFEDGSFRLVNDRNGFTKEYRRNARRDTAQLSKR
jgi:competence protein ComEC